MGIARIDGTVRALPEPFNIDLSAFSTVVKTKIPVNVNRLLIGMTTDKPRSVKWKNGIFCPTQSSFLDHVDKIDEIASTLMRKDDSYGEQYRGLVEIETRDWDKMRFAGAKKKLSFILKNKYPWDVPQDNVPVRDSSVITIASMFRKVALSFVPTSLVSSCSPSKMWESQLSVSYKKGSSYGMCPYVPGMSSANSVALLWHMMTGRVISHELQKKPDVNSWDDLIADIVDDHLNGRSYMRHPHYVMLLKRARPIGSKKPIPLWTIDKDAMSISAKDALYDGHTAERDVKPVAAMMNVQFSLVGAFFADLCHYIPGLDVGHPVQTFEVVREAYDEWGPDNIAFYPEDVTGFDLSINQKGLRSVDLFNDVIFGYNNYDYDISAFSDSLPMVVSGLFDDSTLFESKGYTIMRSSGGLLSGHRLTTLKGTVFNLLTLIEAISLSMGHSVDAVLLSCFNFANILGSKRRDTKWGFLIKGDDLLIFYKKGYLKVSDIVAGRLLLGLKTEAEPGPLFLKRFVTMIPVKGSQFAGCPEKFKDTLTLFNMGLLLTRYARRVILVEHPITDIRPGRLAIYGSIVDLAGHVEGNLAESVFLALLNSVDSIRWTSFDQLYRYVHSDKFKKDMMAYAEEARSTDSFLRDLLNRRALGSSLTNPGSVDLLPFEDEYLGDILNEAQTLTVQGLDVNFTKELTHHQMSQISDDPTRIALGGGPSKNVSPAQAATIAKLCGKYIFKHLNFDIK